MKIKLSELKNAEPSLRKLLNSENLNVKLAYRLSRTVSKIDSELKQLEATRIRLVNKYGKKNKDGSVTVKEDNMQNFTKDMESLLFMEVELDINKININELPENAGLSPVDFSSINFLLTE